MQDALGVVLVILVVLTFGVAVFFMLLRPPTIEQEDEERPRFHPHPHERHQNAKNYPQNNSG